MVQPVENINDAVSIKDLSEDIDKYASWKQITPNKTPNTSMSRPGMPSASKPFGLGYTNNNSINMFDLKSQENTNVNENDMLTPAMITNEIKRPNNFSIMPAFKTYQYVDRLYIYWMHLDEIDDSNLNMNIVSKYNHVRKQLQKNVQRP